MAEEKKTSDTAGKKADKKAQSKPAKPKKKSKKNPLKSIASFFKSVRAEGKKVVWAKGHDVFKNTIIVLVVCAIVGVAIYLVDTGLTYSMKGIKKAADNYKTSVSDQVEEETTGTGIELLDQLAEAGAEGATNADTTQAAE